MCAAGILGVELDLKSHRLRVLPDEGPGTYLMALAAQPVLKVALTRST